MHVSQLPGVATRLKMTNCSVPAQLCTRSQFQREPRPPSCLECKLFPVAALQGDKDETEPGATTKENCWASKTDAVKLTLDQNRLTFNFFSIQFFFFYYYYFPHLDLSLEDKCLSLYCCNEIWITEPWTKQRLWTECTSTLLQFGDALQVCHKVAILSLHSQQKGSDNIVHIRCKNMFYWYDLQCKSFRKYFFLFYVSQYNITKCH